MNEIKRVIRIRGCIADCPYEGYDGFAHVCSQKGTRVDSHLTSTPDWCPLDNDLLDQKEAECAELREDVKKRINDNLELGFNYGLLKDQNADLTRQLEEAQDTIKKLEEKIDGKQEVLDERLSLIQKLDVKILSLAEKLKDAEAQPEKARKALEGIIKCREKWRDCPDDKFAERDCEAWNAIKQAALAGKEKL